MYIEVSDQQWLCAWIAGWWQLSTSLRFTSIKADDLEIYSNTISRNARIMVFPSKILSLIKAKSAFDPRLIGIKMPNFTLCTPSLCKAGFFQCFLHVEKGSFFFSGAYSSHWFGHCFFFSTSASSNHSLEPLWCWQRVSLEMSPNWTCTFHHIHDTTAKLVPGYLEDHPS